MYTSFGTDNSAYHDFRTKYYRACLDRLSLRPLLPHLIERRLITSDEEHELRNEGRTENDRIQYLLGNILRKKDSNAVQTFMMCIAAEKEHSGHVELTEMFRENSELS